MPSLTSPVSSAKIRPQVGPVLCSEDPETVWTRVLDAIPGRREKRATGPQGMPYVKVQCPAHDDKGPSLTVTQGDKRVLLHCFAGCSEDDVLAAIGWTKEALFYEPARRPDRETTGRARRARSRKPSSVPRPAPKRERVDPERSYKTMRLGKLGAPKVTYTYCDADGAIAYVVARYVEADGGKTFRQFRPAPTPGEWFRQGPTDSERVLYRLPELREAITRGDRIILVEGEKDADNGNAAEIPGLWFTSAAGGAKAPWQPQYTQQLAGASSVTIVADKDEPGRCYAATVRAVLAAAGLTVDVMQAATGKDWSDHAAAGGTIEDLEPATDLPDLEPAGDDGGAGDIPPGAGSDGDYDDDSGLPIRIVKRPAYIVKDGKIWRSRVRYADGKPYIEQTLLLGCLVEITATVIVSSGDPEIDKLARGEISRHRLRATHPETGEVLELEVTPKEWRDGSWLDSLWTSIIFPATRQGRSEITEAVRAISADAPRITVHGATGWTTIGGKRAYVHAGGAITADDVLPVETDMPRAVSVMELPTPPTTPAAITRAAEESMGLMSLDWIPARIGFVLAGAAYRAILPSASLVPLMVAPPGSGKTETSILAAQHFAPSLCHDHKQFVSMAALGATAKAAQAVMHRAADALLIVDDFPPQTSGRNSTDAQSDMIRAAYDRASREALTQERQFKPGPAPRCVVFSSAEYAPADTGARERALVVPMPWGSKPPVPQIAEAQRMEHASERAAFMAFLIRCTAARTEDEISQWTRETDQTYQAALREAGYSVRSSEHVGRVVTGWAWATACLVTAGVWTEEQRADYLAGPVWDAALEAAEANAEPDADASAADRLLRLVRESIGARAHLCDARKEQLPPDGREPAGCGWVEQPNSSEYAPVHRPTGDRIGWVKGERVWLQPGPALRVAIRGAEDEGVQLHAHSDAAAAQLLADAQVGMYCDGGRNTRQVRVSGRQVRVWDLPASLFWPEEGPSGDPAKPTPPAPASAPAPEPAPLSICGVCGKPMRPVDGATYHPTCQPTEARTQVEPKSAPATKREHATTGETWRAAEALITPTEAILPDGERLPLGEIRHAGDLAVWAARHRIGWAKGRRIEPGHLYLSAEALAAFGLPAGDDDRDKQGKQLARSRAELEFWTGATEDGFSFGAGPATSSWVRLWRTHDDETARGSAVITSAHWLRGMSLTEGAATDAQVIRRLGLWTELVGTPVVITEGVTFKAMADLPGIDLPDLPWNQLALDFMWRRDLTEVEQAKPYVAAYDRRKSYLAACSSVEAGEALEHVVSPVPDPRRAGFWRVTSSTWPTEIFDQLPHPAYDVDDQPCEWVASPTLALMMEHGTVEVAEAWLYPTQRRVLEPVYKRVKAALGRLEDCPADEDTQVVERALKASYTRGLGMLAQLSDAGQNKRGHRPDVRALVIATHRANSMRAMIHAGAAGSWPLAMARNDAVLFAVDDPDPVAAWPGKSDGMGPQLGKYKAAGSTPMAEFLRLTEPEPDSPSRAVWAVTDPEQLHRYDNEEV